MYKISVGLDGNREPWLLPIEERRKLVLQAKASGKKVALMLYHQADSSTFRYRCYNVMQATKNSAIWQSVYFYLNELQTVNQLLDESDLLIMARLHWVHALDDVVMAAHRRHIPVLFDIDDLVFDINYFKMVTNTLNVQFREEADYSFWYLYISRIQHAASLADGYITTNSLLGEKLQQKFGKPFQIIENALNAEQLAVSERCLRIKERKISRKPFTIGYFSGSPSHINDFRVVAQELMAFLEDYEDAVLQVVGFMEFPPAMQPLIREKRVTFTPLVDFLELQKLIAEVDVNIVPLVQNTFTNCKSQLKYFEAAVVDTVTVATPTFTYQDAICHGETGFLCEPGQWYDCIEKLYKNPDLSKQMAKAARTACLQRWAGENFCKEIENAYNYFTS